MPTTTAPRGQFIPLQNKVTKVINPICFAPVTIAVPSIPEVAQIATATPGTWNEPVTLTYQWLRDNVAISGATATTYRLAVADIGAFITVREKATGNASGKTNQFTSNKVGPVTDIPPP